MGRKSKRLSGGENLYRLPQTDEAVRGKRYRAGIYARLSADSDTKDCRQNAENRAGLLRCEGLEVQINIAMGFVEEWNQNHTDKIEVADCYMDV